jgi:hypothetical protein
VIDLIIFALLTVTVVTQRRHSATFACLVLIQYNDLKPSFSLRYSLQRSVWARAGLSYLIGSALVWTDSQRI